MIYKKDTNTADTAEMPKFSFLILLICLISFSIIPPYFSVKDGGVWQIVILTTILLSSLYLVAHKRNEFLIGCLLALTTIASSWSDYLLTSPVGASIIISQYLVFFGYIMFMLGRYLLETEKVSANMIFASMCLYFLIGLVWTFVYYWIELSTPGSFTNLPEIPDSVSREWFLLSHFAYYSSVTLSTLGYGDVAPLTRVARSWATMEAIIGQFYLAVVVARLVGLHVSTKRK